MIVCHRYRFIFVKTRKTAGSSVEIALSRLCGPGDVVTPLVRHLGEEDLRCKEGGFGPDGYLKRWHEHRGIREWRRLLTRFEPAARFRGHATAGELRAQLPESIWNDYLKISVERNPWDRAMSRYWWNRYRWEREGKWCFTGMTDFLAYLESEKPEQLSNWPIYAIGDRIAVDRVLKYESLSSDLRDLSAALNADVDLSLPRRRAKGDFRKESRHYTEVLADADRAIIERACAREIEHFGYRYGD